MVVDSVIGNCLARLPLNWKPNGMGLLRTICKVYRVEFGPPVCITGDLED